MSILASSTPFTIHNNTNHFIEISIQTEQDESFRVSTRFTKHVIPINYSDVVSDASGLGYVIEQVGNWFAGDKLHEIKINLPQKDKVDLVVGSISSLTFKTNVKDQHVSNVISGDFNIQPELQGDKMHIEYISELGYGYDDNDDVAIGNVLPTKRDMLIKTNFKNKNNKKISGIKVVPVTCKLKTNV